MPHLHDTQLLVLAAASQRTDGLLSPPERLRGAALDRFGAKLVELHLATERPVSLDEPAWQQSDERGRIGLMISATGLTAIGLEPEERPTELEPPPAATDSPSATAAPRSGSKIAVVLELLQRLEGASIDEISAATQWLPHTIRAALPGLRTRGHVIELRRGGDDRAAYHTGVSS